MTYDLVLLYGNQEPPGEVYDLCSGVGFTSCRWNNRETEARHLLLLCYDAQYHASLASIHNSLH